MPYSLPRANVSITPTPAFTPAQDSAVAGISAPLQLIACAGFGKMDPAT